MCSSDLRLAHTGFADEAGVVLLAAAQDLDGAVIHVDAAHHGGAVVADVALGVAEAGRELVDAQIYILKKLLIFNQQF